MTKIITKAKAREVDAFCAGYSTLVPHGLTDRP